MLAEVDAKSQKWLHDSPTGVEERYKLSCRPSGPRRRSDLLARPGSAREKKALKAADGRAGGVRRDHQASRHST